uniref:ADP-ribosylation factor-like protein 2-binding protein n=2 Tax=Arion vulgaris TaxID=1028688 RepID=A0A0B7AGV8_9EUPU
MASNSSNNSRSVENHEEDLEQMDFSLDEYNEDEDLETGLSAQDVGFDSVIGHIEDIIMEESFQSIQNGFLEKYYKEFEDTEENKFCYTDIHKEYISTIESYLETELKKRMPDFSMQEFFQNLQARKNELEGEIFEILLTFSDFMAFKEMLIDYRADREGSSVDLSGGLMVVPVQDKLCISGASPFCISGKSIHGP